MNRKKIGTGLVLGIFALSTMMIGVGSASAISINDGKKAGLGDLFVLDNLFKGSTDNRILGAGTNGKTDLGNLFILDQLFNEQVVEPEVVVPPVVVPPVTSVTPSLGQQLSGRILIQVESKGEAWYVNPVTKKRVFLGTPTQTIARLADVGLGITNKDFDDISSAGVPDRLAGRVIIKTQDNGKLFYIDPISKKINSVGNANEAVNLIKAVGLGINNANITKIAVSN